MGRLIDADHALQRFIKEAEAGGTGCIHINTIKRLLQDIDTAYDVEKVVAEVQNVHLPLASQTAKIVGIIRKGGISAAVQEGDEEDEVD